MALPLPEFLAALLGYLIGSLTFAVWVAKSQGVDILKVGSGNPGATNVKRVLGAKWGYLVFALDAAKGFAAVVLAAWIFSSPYAAGWAFIGAVLGHSFSFLLRFKGGKAVATTIGGLLALMPWVILPGLLIWGVVFKLTRFVSTASLAMAWSLPLFAWVTRQPGFLMAIALFMALLITYRHRSNLQRLLSGKENRS